jgi:hypothetical protein
MNSKKAIVKFKGNKHSISVEFLYRTCCNGVYEYAFIIEGEKKIYFGHEIEEFTYCMR